MHLNEKKNPGTRKRYSLLSKGVSLNRHERKAMAVIGILVKNKRQLEIR